MTKVFNEAGINSNDYSTHAYRKGGTRHKLRFSKQKWSMDVIMAWAHWSHEADKKVLWSYLVDEERFLRTEEVAMAMKFNPSSKQSLDTLVSSQLN